MKHALILTPLLALAACAVGPNYARPDVAPAAERGLRGANANAAADAQPLPGKWWRLFDDPAIDPLVERALARNSDIRVAAANLRRARAILSEARAGRLPTSNFTGSATRNRIVSGAAGFGGTAPGVGTPGTGTPGTGTPGTGTPGTGTPGTGTPGTGTPGTGTPGTGTPGTGGSTGAGVPIDPIETDFYSLGFDASYELDLFGRVSRSIEAARADRAAAQADLDAARVAVAAETARSYAQACGFAAQALVARETATLQGRTLELTRRLFEGGRGTQREVDQANVLVQQAEAQVAQFEAERRASLYALAALTGDPPATTDGAAEACRRPPQVRAAIPAGDGAALLARRPDVRAAERRLAGQTARIGVATAALYPSVTLLGSVTLSATDPGDLFKSSAFGYSVGPLISFNFPFTGAARARVRQAEASTEAALATFDGIWLTALRETEQALARADGAVRQELALGRALASAENAARLSRLRFDYGADNFLQLLDSERSRAEARIAAAQAAAARADAQVSLFKALGGGWEYAPEPVRTLD